MQDNRNDKFNSEDQFMNQAWSNMEEMLDQEMPVMPTAAPKRSKKTYGLLLLLWIVGFGAGVSSILLWQQKMEPITPVEPVANSPIAATQDAPVPPTVIHSDGPPKLFAESQLNNLSKQVADKSFVKDQKTINRATAVLKNTPTNFGSTNNSTSDKSSTFQNNSINLNAALALPPPNTTTPNHSLALESKALTSFENSMLTPLAIQRADFDGIAVDDKDLSFTKLLVPTLKKITFNWGLMAGLHSEPTKGFGGYSAGLTLDAEVDRKFGISTGLMFSRFQFNDIILNDSPDAFALNQHNTHPGVYNDVTEVPFQVRSSNPSSSPVRLGSAQYISIPLLLTYKASRMFRVNMGVEYARMLGASSIQMTSNSTQDYNASYKWYDNSSAYGELLNKTNFTALFGLSLKASENVGFDLRYNHGFSDLSSNKGQFSVQNDTRESLQFSIMYSFGVRPK